MWWLLRWLGHDAVALLDGGIQRWSKQIQSLATEIPDATPTTFTAQPDDRMWVARRRNRTGHPQPGRNLIIDARSEERFSGEREMLDKVAGHIPGSINYPFEDNLDMDSTYLPTEELREAYMELLDGTARKTSSICVAQASQPVTA